MTKIGIICKPSNPSAYSPTMKPKREKVIDKVYTDVKTGYGSIQATLDEAKKINSLITHDGVKTY